LKQVQHIVCEGALFTWHSLRVDLVDIVSEGALFTWHSLRVDLVDIISEGALFTWQLESRSGRFDSDVMNNIALSWYLIHNLFHY